MASNVLLFGDDQADKVPAIRSLYRASRTQPQLCRFLREASDIVQREITSLAEPHERLRISQFDDLLELAEHLEASEHPEATTCAILITTAQVGELLCLTGCDPTILSGNSDVSILGFCIGLLGASVAAGARDTSELVSLGVEAVAVSFRLGLELTRRARLIEDSSRGWSAVLVGSKVDIERNLRTFNKSVSPLRQAFVGVAASSWVTIFGPPSTLAAIFACHEFDRYPKSLHVGTTAVHAPDLPRVNIDGIVGKSQLFETTPVCRTVFPWGSRDPSEGMTTVRALLEHAVIDIASSMLWPEEAVSALNVYLESPDLTLIQVGPTGYMPMVQTLLRGKRVATRTAALAQKVALESTTIADSSLVAIVGMSGRFPGCNDDLEELWDLLVAGETTHEEVPASRFALHDFYDPTQTTKNAVLNRYGCFLRSPGLFDPRLFRVSPREAMQIDPLHRIFLMTTYEALQQAGYGGVGPDSMHKSRTCTFFGQTTDDWRTINDQQGIETHYAPSSNRAFASGRVAHFFGWNGGACSVDTACSSSATCIHLACESLITRESDTAVVGGGSLCVIPEPFSGLGKGGFLSLSTQDGSCKTFQESADGYCRGEAVGVVVLKRLQDALAENDNILAVIRGSARNSNAGVASITYPCEAAQEALFRTTLRKCNVDPSHIGFVEMHGTGTQAGDKVETSSICKVFGQDRTTNNPLYLGAVKANVGHSEAAAGVVSLIKAVLMLRHDGVIPPQPGYPFALNRSFGNLSAANIKVADGCSLLQAWPNSDSTRKVLINSFDAAGGNTAILVQDRPKPKVKLPLSRSHHCIAISGSTIASLIANKVRLREFLIGVPEVIFMGDLAYTTTARRLHETHREAFVASSVTELCDMLAQKPVQRRAADPSSLIFVFQGEGSLCTGMGATLYETSPYFRHNLDAFQTVSDTQGQRAKFVDIIRGVKDATHASAPERQMAIVALEIALAQYWQSLGLAPTLVLGHSLGEYAALCVAGVISIADTLFLVHARATQVEEHCRADSFAMLAVAQPARYVEHFLAQGAYSSCEIACVSAPASAVVSGDRVELRELERRMHDQGIQTTILPVRYGFHSAQMDPALDAFEEAAAAITYAKPRIPVASSVLAKIVTEKGIFGSTYLRQHMRQPVRFVHAVRACETAGVIKNGSSLIDVGLDATCARLVIQSLQETSIHFCGCLQREQDVWKSINTVLANAYANSLPVNWQEFYKHDLENVQLVDLPRYAFDVKDYWHSYQTRGTPLIVENAAGFPSSKDHASIDRPHRGADFLESADIEEGTAVFVFDTADSTLSFAIQGHLIDGLPICPVPVFADMAITATIHLLHLIGTTAKASDLELVDMNMTNPLVVQKGSNKIVRVMVGVRDSGRSTTIAFSSGNDTGRHEHGTCTIRVHSSSHRTDDEWDKVQKLVRGQVRALKREGEAAIAHRMNAALVYKLFSSLVDYSQEYMAIKDAFVSLDFKEAAALVDLGVSLGLDHLTVNPFAVDALVHLAGFLLNANLSKPADDIYIANYVERLHVLEDLSAIAGHPCTSFASIRQHASKTQAFCDVYVYNDQKLIAACSIRFQKLSRDMFRSITAKFQDSSLTRANRSTATVRPGGKVDTIEQAPDTKYVDSFDSSEGNTLVSDNSSYDVSGLLLGIIAQHTGMRPSDIDSESRIIDLGIDSLMAIAISQHFERKTSVALPVGYLTSMETVAQALKGLGAQIEQTKYSGEHEHGPSWHSMSRGTTSEETLQVSEGTSGKRELSLDSVTSRAVLIQGSSHNNKRPLFLITDGSGSVSGYIHLPALPCGRRILALESPFKERPQDYRLSIEEMAHIFMLTIRQEQPHGVSFQGNVCMCRTGS